MNEPVLMKCGHTANAEYDDGKPCCLICSPKREAYEVVDEKPNLTGRKAKCTDCGEIVDSNWNLPFFEYCPDKEYDRFYSGCWGWD
ncbi:MAG: hypothetical protein IJS58_08925 [Bacilli bacterium]|nr:hypothetical protein [Bacilli bacterium]